MRCGAELIFGVGAGAAGAAGVVGGLLASVNGWLAAGEGVGPAVWFGGG